MKSHSRFVVSFCLTALIVTFVKSSAAEVAYADLVVRVRADAARVAKTPASNVFYMLTSKDGCASLGLTEDQRDLSRRLEILVRDALVALLLRGLDDKTRPAEEELARRLGEVCKRDRREVVSNAEAIVLEVILTPRQASRARKAYKVKPAAPLVGRYRASRRPAAEVLQSVTELKDVVEHEQRSLRGSIGGSSSLFDVVVNFRVPPGKQSVGTPSTAELGLWKTLKLSIEQTGLANRLDRLNCDVLHAWLSRNLVADLSRLEDWEAADWYDTRARQRESFIAHSETIVLQGLLSPSQAKTLLAHVWRYMGPSALADPELAAHLNLTRAQRSTVVEQLETCRSIREEIIQHLIGLMEFRGKKDEFGRDIAEVARQEKQRVQAEADWMVWSVLTRSQRNELSRILGVNIREPQPALGPGPDAPAGRQPSTHQALIEGVRETRTDGDVSRPGCAAQAVGSTARKALY